VVSNPTKHLLTSTQTPQPRVLLQRLRVFELSLRRYVLLKQGGRGGVLLIHCSCVHLLQDSNWGLAKQALCALTRQKIKRLTRTYITLSLSQVATEAGLPSEAAAQEHLLAMVMPLLYHATRSFGVTPPLLSLFLVIDPRG